jgi:ketosteroid isomerase-like protein
VSAEENTRLVQRAYEAFGRGDMAALAEVMADDIEWVDSGDPNDDPNAGMFKGKEAVLGWFGGLASTRGAAICAKVRTTHSGIGTTRQTWRP